MKNDLDAAHRLRHIQRVGDTAFQKFKPGVAGMMGDIVDVSIAEIIQHPHMTAMLYQMIDKMRADKTGPTGNQASFR
jgi:hypothetical protein